MIPDYQTDKIRFFNCDCIEFMKTIPDKYYDIAIIDPPYGIGEDGSKNHSRSKLAIAKNYKPYAGNDKKAPDKIFFDESIRVSKNQIIWGANHFISKIPYDSSSWIVWDKNNGENDFADCELAYTSFDTAVRKFKYTWNGMLQENMKNKEFRTHPNQKPIQLYRWILKKYAKQGEKILDTHGGSMTIARACDMEGFELDICEIDEEYFETGIKEFKKYKSQMTMFD